MTGGVMMGGGDMGTAAGWLVDEYEASVGVAGEVSVAVSDGQDVLPSRLATTDLAVGSVVAAAGAALRLLRARAGREGAATVDGRRVSGAFRSDKHFRLDGARIDGFAALSGFWRARDGWVRTHANYPHHRARLLGALSLPDETRPAEFGQAVAARDAAEVEQVLADADAVGVAVRSPQEWAAHAQARAVAELPLVGSARLDGSPPRLVRELPAHSDAPAAGVRVL